MLIETLYKSFKQQPDFKLVNMSKNNSVEMFENNLFKDIFQDVVLEKYSENQYALSKLVGSDVGYFNTVYSLMTKDLYSWYKSQG